MKESLTFSNIKSFIMILIISLPLVWTEIECFFFMELWFVYSFQVDEQKKIERDFNCLRSLEREKELHNDDVMWRKQWKQIFSLCLCAAMFTFTSISRMRELLMSLISLRRYSRDVQKNEVHQKRFDNKRDSSFSFAAWRQWSRCHPHKVIQLDFFCSFISLSLHSKPPCAVNESRFEMKPWSSHEAKTNTRCSMWWEKLKVNAILLPKVYLCTPWRHEFSWERKILVRENRLCNRYKRTEVTSQHDFVCL